MVGEQDVRNVSKNSGQNSVLIKSLALSGHVDINRAGEVHQNIERAHGKICHAHTVHATQYLLAELTIRMCMSLVGSDGFPRKPYVTDVQIPVDLVNALNAINGGIVISRVDVKKFINEAVKRYYATPMWPLTEVGVQAVAHEEDSELSDTEMSTGEDYDTERSCELSDNSCAGMMDETESDEGSVSSASTDMERATLKETDPAALSKYYLVEGRLLVQLFQFCPKCGSRLSGTELSGVGTAAIVDFICSSCSKTEPRVQRWESQTRTVAHEKEKTYRGNVAAAVAAITTGVRYVELKRWAQELNLALFSDWFYKKIFKWTRPSIASVYEKHQGMVMDIVRARNGGEKGLDLAADGAYDSRGYSALIGRVVLVDTRTKLVLHTEVLHRSETGGVSGRMEIEGLRRLLRWVISLGMSVASLTTDRSKAIGALLKEMEPEVGAIRQYYDGWHLTKWLGNKLRKVSKQTDCGSIALWIEPLKTHLWSSMEMGMQEGHSALHLFNTCLMHVLDIHEWPEGDITGKYRRCRHGPLEGPRPQTLDLHSKAYQSLRNVVLTPSFQRDVPMASPSGGTSVCESKNAVDRIYCKKEVFYPITTYPYYTMMATMHMNTLRMAEIAGERNVVRVHTVQRKYLQRKSKIVEKTSVEHLWRRQIFEDVLVRRLAQLNDGNANDLDDNNNIDIDMEQEL